VSSTDTIIIVNFNSGDHLARCLDSIAEHAKRAGVLVIDNASSDASERPARDAGPVVKLLCNNTNVGFARAVNQGLARTSGDFVLLLNPDCQLRAGAVEALVAEMLQHPQCAVAGPLVLDEDGSIQGSVRGDPTLLTGLFGRSTLLTRMFPASRLARRNVRLDMASEADPTSTEVNWVSGACMLARREALEAIGGFDERYFLYWEDADACRRLRNCGYTIRCVPAACVVHVAGQSSRSAPAMAIRAFHRSAYTYYATHVARCSLARGVARILLEARCRLKLLGTH
jgi:GT2 family glycosyltransferase